MQRYQRDLDTLAEELAAVETRREAELVPVRDMREQLERHVATLEVTQTSDTALELSISEQDASILGSPALNRSLPIASEFERDEVPLRAVSVSADSRVSKSAMQLDQPQRVRKRRQQKDTAKLEHRRWQQEQQHTERLERARLSSGRPATVPYTGVPPPRAVSKRAGGKSKRDAAKAKRTQCDQEAEVSAWATAAEQDSITLVETAAGRKRTPRSGRRSLKKRSGDALRATAVATSRQASGSRAPIDVPLPVGWERRVSRTSGKIFYACPALRITQWEPPPLLWNASVAIADAARLSTFEVETVNRNALAQEAGADTRVGKNW